MLFDKICWLINAWPQFHLNTALKKGKTKTKTKNEEIIDILNGLKCNKTKQIYDKLANWPGNMWPGYWLLRQTYQETFDCWPLSWIWHWTDRGEMYSLISLIKITKI